MPQTRSLVLPLILASSALAQTVYVDPTFGSDLAGGGGAANPFRTVTFAVANMNMATTVHLHPGIYSPVTNGETFPVRLPAGVNLQSAGADKVVWIGDQSAPYAGPQHFPQAVGIFLPTSPADGARDANQEVLLDLSFAQSGAVVEGITFRGGNVQVYKEWETFGSVRIQNCVFDMLDQPDDPNHDPRFRNVGGPMFGVLSVGTWDWHNAMYHNGEIEFIHNTVVMAWQPDPDDGDPVTALDGAVGFCDVNDPASIYGPPIISDPDTTLRAINDHLIVNNIFRTVEPQTGSATRAMLGVDGADTFVFTGTQLGDSNAFDANLVGGNTMPGGAVQWIFWSAVPAPLQFPTPVIDVNTSAPGGRDGAFVGEYISRTYWSDPNRGQNDRFVRDWRLLPASPYKELGTAPVAEGAQQIIRVSNGMTYIDPVGRSSVFDWDGEEFGNPRIASDPQNPAYYGEPDLGFDEASNLIVARGNANDSVAHSDFTQRFLVANGIAYPDGVGVGQDQREIIVPGAGTLTISVEEMTIPAPPPIMTTEWPTLSAPGAFLGGFLGYDRYYLLGANTIGPVSVPTTAVTGYLAPYDPTGLSFGRIAGIAEPAVGDKFYSVQAAFAPTVGNAAFTNAQSYSR